MFVLLSRAFGLVRDMAMAALFGSAPAMDAFVVAFTVPNLFRGLLGEGALSAAFVPVFTKSLEQESRERTWTFVSNMMTFLGAVLLVLTALGIIGMTAARAWAPLSPRVDLILRLASIMLPYMFLICMAAFFSAILNSLRKFIVPAAVPVAMNIVMIAALLLLCPYVDPARRVTWVAWSVIAAGAVQFMMQWPQLRAVGFRPRFSFAWSDPAVRRVWLLMGAAAIGLGVTQINVLVGRVLAVIIGQGAPSYLYYAERLIYFPLGLFATALGTVLLPTFSKHAVLDQLDQLRDTLNHSIRHLMFIMVPAAVGLWALAHPIVRLVYERGDFTAYTTDMTTLAVICYAPGLVVFSLIKVFVPVFYAQQDMKTPVRISIYCTLLNAALNLILMWPLKHAGIALAATLSAAVQVALLAVLVHRRVGSPGWRHVAGACLKMVLASAVMAGAAIAAHRGLMAAPELNAWPDVIRQITVLVASMGLALVVYLAMARLCRCGELSEVWEALSRRATRVKR